MVSKKESPNFQWSIFRGKLAVSFREGKPQILIRSKQAYHEMLPPFPGLFSFRDAIVTSSSWWKIGSPNLKMYKNVSQVTRQYPGKGCELNIYIYHQLYHHFLDALCPKTNTTTRWKNRPWMSRCITLVKRWWFSSNRHVSFGGCKMFVASGKAKPLITFTTPQGFSEFASFITSRCCICHGKVCCYDTFPKNPTYWEMFQRGATFRWNTWLWTGFLSLKRCIEKWTKQSNDLDSWYQ